VSEERQNSLTRVSKEILLCWKMLVVKHVEHPSTRLRKAGQSSVKCPFI